MARITRSRQVSATVNKKDVKINTKGVATGKVTKTNSAKAKANTKKVLQDENAVLTGKKGKVTSLKNTHSKAVLGSKLHPLKKDDSLVRKSTVLAMKSPVLRDRTNTSNETNKDDVSNKKKNKIISNQEKKVVQKSSVTKATKENDNSSGLQESLKRYTEKVPAVQKRSLRKKSSQETAPESVETDELTQKKSINTDDNTNSSKVKRTVKDLESKVNDKIEDQVSNKMHRRQNISIEDLEELLNRDEEEVDSDNVENAQEENNSENHDINQQPKSNKNLESKNKEEVNENEQKNLQVTKKFFKHKVKEQEIKPSTATRKNTRRQVNKKRNGVGKKVQNNDSTFSPKIEEETETMEPPEKKLRPRANKNYCDDSKLSQNDSSKNKQVVQENPDVLKDHKGLPIYKTISLSQEKVKDKEEIYEFPDDSQESEPKGKKRKKAVKRPTVKRVKKAVVSKTTALPKTVKKSNKKDSRNVHFQEQTKSPIIVQNNVVINNIQSNYIVPEHLQDAGDSTIQEASTIKIINDKKLEGSKRISLTATPPVPKTINSELKLYGPKNAITSLPTTQYSNMVNHSLIRQSMSPITKVEERFDVGSPWRPIETFSRIQKVVQSTPQINRLPLNREKKLPTHMMNLQKKSISSEDTIHISSLSNNKSSNKEITKQTITPSKENEVSPRKFGTVISNLSPVQSKSIISVNNSSVENNQQSPVQIEQNQKSPVQTAQNNQQSPVEAALAPTSCPDLSIEDVSTIPAISNKENTIPSPKKSPKKKITPSPFRFEKIRSSKRIASMESNSLKSSVQKGSEEPDLEAGPSKLDKQRPTFLKQTNLNNFLNLDEMPESTCISTSHGIFDDIHSTPINGKKPKKLLQEPNIENAFGFDDCEMSEVSSVVEKGSIIATEKDVKESKKGKLFVKARVKSAVPSRISANTVKKALLKTDLINAEQNKDLRKEKSEEERRADVFKDSDESDSDKENYSEEENESVKNYMQNINDRDSSKKALLDAVSFSDTFDVISEKGEDVKSKVPDEVPLFVDLEPAHFEQPPRRSYSKRKRAVQFNTSTDFEDDEEEKPKPKKKKESKLSKEDRKRMEEWVKNINETFEEIDHFDLVVE